MNMKTLSFIIFSILFSTPALGGEEVATLSEGDPAPFDGTIFNIEASARLLTSLEFTSQSCDIKVREEVERTEARYQLDIDTITASRASLQERYDATLLIKNDQIDWLEQQVAKPGTSRQLWFVVGILVGSAVTIGSGHALHQIAN
tara:strand:- start:254 stop:691 length:438 start_codon:yes stop_codon:yes gene_type:complete